MKVQNLKALLNKQSENAPKEVLVIVDNKEYKITGISAGVDKVTLNTESVTKIVTRDSVENQKERTRREKKESKFKSKKGE